MSGSNLSVGPLDEDLLGVAQDLVGEVAAERAEGVLRGEWQVEDGGVEGEQGGEEERVLEERGAGNGGNAGSIA